MTHGLTPLEAALGWERVGDLSASRTWSSVELVVGGSLRIYPRDAAPLAVLRRARGIMCSWANVAGNALLRAAARGYSMSFAAGCYEGPAPVEFSVWQEGPTRAPRTVWCALMDPHRPVAVVGAVVEALGLELPRPLRLALVEELLTEGALL